MSKEIPEKSDDQVKGPPRLVNPFAQFSVNQSNGGRRKKTRKMRSATGFAVLVDPYDEAAQRALIKRVEQILDTQVNRFSFPLSDTDRASLLGYIRQTINSELEPYNNLDPNISPLFEDFRKALRDFGVQYKNKLLAKDKEAKAKAKAILLVKEVEEKFNMHLASYAPYFPLVDSPRAYSFIDKLYFETLDAAKTDPSFDFELLKSKLLELKYQLQTKVALMDLRKRFDIILAGCGNGNTAQMRLKAVEKINSVVSEATEYLAGQEKYKTEVCRLRKEYISSLNISLFNENGPSKRSESHSIFYIPGRIISGIIGMGAMFLGGALSAVLGFLASFPETMSHIYERLVVMWRRFADPHNYHMSGFSWQPHLKNKEDQLESWRAENIGDDAFKLHFRIKTRAGDIKSYYALVRANYTAQSKAPDLYLLERVSTVKNLETGKNMILPKEYETETLVVGQDCPFSDNASLIALAVASTRLPYYAHHSSACKQHVARMKKGDEALPKRGGFEKFFRGFGALILMTVYAVVWMPIYMVYNAVKRTLVGLFQGMIRCLDKEFTNSNWYFLAGLRAAFNSFEILKPARYVERVKDDYGNKRHGSTQPFETTLGDRVYVDNIDTQYRLLDQDTEHGSKSYRTEITNGGLWGTRIYFGVLAAVAVVVTMLLSPVIPVLAPIAAVISKVVLFLVTQAGASTFLTGALAALHAALAIPAVMYSVAAGLAFVAGMVGTYVAQVASYFFFKTLRIVGNLIKLLGNPEAKVNLGLDDVGDKVVKKTTYRTAAKAWFKYHLGYIGNIFKAMAYKLKFYTLEKKDVEFSAVTLKRIVAPKSVALEKGDVSQTSQEPSEVEMDELKNSGVEENAPSDSEKDQGGSAPEPRVEKVSPQVGLFEDPLSFSDALRGLTNKTRKDIMMRDLKVTQSEYGRFDTSNLNQSTPAIPAG